MNFKWILHILEDTDLAIVSHASLVVSLLRTRWRWAFLLCGSVTEVVRSTKQLLKLFQIKSFHLWNRPSYIFKFFFYLIYLTREVMVKKLCNIKGDWPSTSLPTISEHCRSGLINTGFVYGTPHVCQCRCFIWSSGFGNGLPNVGCIFIMVYVQI